VKKNKDTFIGFDRIHERDRRTDGQTDGFRMTALASLAFLVHVKPEYKPANLQCLHGVIELAAGMLCYNFSLLTSVSVRGHTRLYKVKIGKERLIGIRKMFSDNVLHL